MKKIVLSTLAISGLIFSITSNAQPGYLAFSPKASDNADNTNYVAPSALSILEATNPKAYKNFTAHYKDFSNLNVSSENNRTYIIFKAKEILTRIKYNKKGEQLYMIRYYGPSKLSVDITKMVKSEFENYAIVGVTEVTVNDRTAYLVKIDNDAFIKTIKVVDDETETIETLVKTN